MVVHYVTAALRKLHYIIYTIIYNIYHHTATASILFI